MKLTKETMKLLVAAILSEELKGYTIQRGVKVPLSLVPSVDVLATSQDQHTIFRRIYVFCEPLERMVAEEVESHQVFRDDLRKHVKFGPKDEYWIVTSGDIEAGGDTHGLVLKDGKWLMAKIKDYLPKSRKVREAVSTLESAGIALPL